MRLELNGVLRQISLWSSFLFMIISNLISSKLPFSPGDQTEKYPNPLLPASYAFSIWGLIFVAQLLFLVFQLRAALRDDTDIGEVVPWILANYMTNGSFVWFTGFDLNFCAFLAIAGNLVALAMAYLKLKIGRRNDLSIGYKILVHVPISLNLSWVVGAFFL